MLNDVVLLDIPMGTVQGRAGRTPGLWARAGAAGCWTSAAPGEQEKLTRLLGTAGALWDRDSSCTAGSTARLREALGAEGCEMQQRPGGSSE